MCSSDLIPVLFVTGDQDQFYSYAQQSEAYLSGQGHPTQFNGAVGVGHNFTGLMTDTTPAEIWTWIGPQTLP